MALLDQGQVVEEYARRLAGNLGVRDFVYRPVLVTLGSGSRELSDGLLVAGDDGLIVQVKSRDPSAGQNDPSDKAERWCRREGARAQRQGNGTKRFLSAGGVTVRSLRGFERTLPPASDWPIVVVLHHLANPAVNFGSVPHTLFLSLADWTGLHQMVRSTAGIIDYVRRALASGIVVPLGHESDRYRRLAGADVRWASFSSTAQPVLPPRPLEGADRIYADLFDDLVEKIADPVGATGWSPEDYLFIVEQLDRTPVLARARIGAKMLKTFRSMVKNEARRSFIAVDQEAGSRLAFLYDYDDGSFDDPDGKGFIAGVASYGLLRHNHALAVGADARSVTLAVGVLHHPERGGRYSFALYRGKQPELPADMQASLEAEFGIFTGREVVKRT